MGKAIHGTRLYELVPESVSGDSFPLNFEPALQDPHRHYFPLDQNGVPLQVFPVGGRQYVPSRVASFALGHFNRNAAKPNPESLQIFLRLADWFLDSKDALWTYNFAYDGLQPPWVSCLGQGQGISVLVRAYKLTGQARYLDQALRACVPFTRTVAEGGVLSFLAAGKPHYEEYPHEPPTHVLNGHQCAVFALLALAEVEPSVRRMTRLDEVIESTATEWRRWDLGYWSAYDLCVTPAGSRHTASVVYHRLHASAMRYLALKLKDERYAECAAKWERNYANLAHRLRALASKVRYRVQSPTPTA